MKPSNGFQNTSWRVEEEEPLSGGESPFVVPFEIGGKKSVNSIIVPPAQSRVIGVASGKGGTGKTTFTTNLAIALRTFGFRVLIVDADFGLANDHLLLGLEPKGDVGDVLAGRKEIREILLTGPGDIHLLPGGVGSTDLSTLEEYDRQTLAREIGSLEPDYDLMLVDLAAGVAPQIMRFLKPAHDVILVTNPEVTALIDAYGLIKCLSLWKQNDPLELQLVINRVREKKESLTSVQKLRRVVGKHLKNIHMNYLGYIPFDHYLLHSISIQEPVVISHPRSFVTACIRAIAQKISVQTKAWMKQQEEDASIPSYFAKLEQQIYE